MHGCRVHTTWTEMNVTGEVGENTIRLTHPVVNDWVPGDEIIIASTGDVTTLHHSEKARIASISADGYTLTLQKPLKFRHIAVCSGPWDWAGEICWRAEVGLLTRNVKFRGNVNKEWVEWLPPCKLGIGTAFGIQTCFQNRFGHEEGSDQFGAHLIVHKAEYGRLQESSKNGVSGIR